MSPLQGHLSSGMLERLAGSFSAATGGKVWILADSGETLAWAPAGAGATPPETAPRRVVTAHGRHVLTVVLADRPDCPHTDNDRLLALMSDALEQLWVQATKLRARVEELAAIYRFTEVFSGRTNLEEVLQLVAETMLDVTGAGGCSIRVLSQDHSELVTLASAGLSRGYIEKGPIRLADSQVDQEVLATRKCVFIADQRTDPRVLYPAEARDEGIVSALCAPMTYKGGVEGVIRVYTRRPHQFDWFETSLITGVASQAASAIVNLRLYEEHLRADRVNQQLKLAADVQQRMVPPAPNISGLDISAIYIPCFQVGGDFYDFIEMPNGNLAVCVGDVKGKGVPASLLMASARSSLRAHAKYLYDLSEILAAVNQDLIEQSHESDFLTLFYGVLDVPRLRLTYCSAGHEPALLVRDGADTALSSLGGVVGLFEDMTYPQQVLDLAPGDVLALSSDGLPEATNFEDEPFGRERSRQAVLEACRRGDPADAIGRHQLWEMRRFAGLQTRFDDLTLVTIKVQ